MPPTAPASNVDPALAAIIAQIESSGSDYALRFEPGQYDPAAATPLIFSIARVNDCSDDTARVISACSWGRYQIMGFNLYGSLGLAVPAIQFCADTSLQLAFFAKFLTANNINVPWSALKNDSTALYHFAKTYNGDGTAYSAVMLRAAQELSL